MEQNNQNQFNLSQISDVQLKAFAYDKLAKIETAQANLRFLNQEIATRAKAASAVPSNGVGNADLPVIN